MEPAYGKLRVKTPMRQRVIINIALPRTYTLETVNLVITDVYYRVITHEKVAATPDAQFAAVTIPPRRLSREQHVNLSFEVMTETSVAEYDQLTTELYSRLIDLGSKESSIKVVDL